MILFVKVESEGEASKVPDPLLYSNDGLSNSHIFYVGKIVRCDLLIRPHGYGEIWGRNDSLLTPASNPLMHNIRRGLNEVPRKEAWRCIIRLDHCTYLSPPRTFLFSHSRPICLYDLLRNQSYTRNKRLDTQSRRRAPKTGYILRIACYPPLQMLVRS